MVGVFCAVAMCVWGGEPGDSAVARSITRFVSEGYWSARADSAAPGGVARGALYRLRAVEARDERGLPLAGFRGDEWAGEPASRAVLEGAQAALSDYLLNGGFPFASTEADLRADSGGAALADVLFRVRRGASFKLGPPDTRETRTHPDVVRRLALWEEGADYAPRRVEQGLRRLARTGYFESADWEGLYRDPTRNLLIPVLRLPDAKASSVGGLLGYESGGSSASGGDGLTGYLDVRLVNLRGTARDFAFAFDSRGAGGAREREARLSYVEPWILNLPVGARYEGSYLQLDTAFWEWNQSLSVFRDLDFNSKVEAEFGAQANQARDETGAALRSRAWRSGVRFVRDARDRAPFTRAGSRLEAGVTGLRRAFEGPVDSAYYLSQFRVFAEHWNPIGERFGLRLAARAASNFPLDRLNRGELYDVGGARSLRGYRERAFQTNAYALGDAEPWLGVGRRGRLFAFASPGLINRPVGHFSPRRVLGYGAGIELARGDWSTALTYALSPERSVGNGFLHVAVENRF